MGPFHSGGDGWPRQGSFYPFRGRRSTLRSGALSFRRSPTVPAGRAGSAREEAGDPGRAGPLHSGAEWCPWQGRAGQGSSTPDGRGGPGGPGQSRPRLSRSGWEGWSWHGRTGLFRSRGNEWFWRGFSQTRAEDAGGPGGPGRSAPERTDGPGGWASPPGETECLAKGGTLPLRRRPVEDAGRGCSTPEEMGGPARTVLFHFTPEARGVLAGHADPLRRRRVAPAGTADPLRRRLVVLAGRCRSTRGDGCPLGLFLSIPEEMRDPGSAG